MLHIRCDAWLLWVKIAKTVLDMGVSPSLLPTLRWCSPWCWDQVFCSLCNSKSWAHNKLPLCLLTKFMNVFYKAGDLVPIPFEVSFGGDAAKTGGPQLSRELGCTWPWHQAHFSPRGIALRGLSSHSRSRDGRRQGRIIPDWWQMMRKVCVVSDLRVASASDGGLAPSRRFR